jgi:hypothetical protein
MSYVGNVPTTAAFPFDQFSGNGSTTAFTLSYAPAGTTSIIVSISGVVQNPNTYSVIGTTLTFTPAPPTGTNNIAVLYLGLPVVATLSPGNTAYFSSSVFTATAGQTVFTPSGTYQTGFINVIRNGSQLAPANYTATNGTTVTLANACTAGDIVVIEVFNLTSIAGALPVTGGTVTGATTFNSGVNLATSSGNVGIGTSSPIAAFKLDVDGYILSRNNASNVSGIYFGVNGNPSQQFTYLTADGRSTGYMAFATNNTERARIDASGVFLVGKTSNADSVVGSMIRGTGYITSTWAETTNATTTYHLYSTGTGGYRFYVGLGGTVFAVSTTISAVSDQRLKENIQDLDVGLDAVMALKPRKFDWKEGQGKDIKGDRGFIAQEFETVFPDLIDEWRDPAPEGEEPYKSVRQDLIPVLVKAIQEQQAMIDELKAKVAALEGAA